MEDSKITLNGIGIIERDDLFDIQEKMLSIVEKVPPSCSGDDIQKARERVYNRGLEFLKEHNLPEIFYTKVRYFYAEESNLPEEELDEVIMVGFSSIILSPNQCNCGFLIIGTKARYSSSYDSVLMECICNSQNALFTYAIPEGSKVIEVLVSHTGIKVIVTCPSEFKNLVSDEAFFIDCIDKDQRFFKDAGSSS